MKIINFFRSDVETTTSLEYKGITKFVPLIICGSFYLITILLFIFGPFDWNISNKFDLYSFLFLTVIFLCLGYYVGTKLKYKKNNFRLNLNHVMYVCFGIYLINFVLTCYATTGKFYPDIIRGLFDSGNAYRISHSSLGSLEVVLYYIGIITSPIISFIIPILFIFGKNLNKVSKVFGIITVILNIFLGVAQGIINSYAVYIFQICLFIFIYFFSNFKKISLKKKVGMFFASILLFLSFFGYYRIVMQNRLLRDTVVEPDNTVVVDVDNNDDNNNPDNNEKEEAINSNVDDILSVSSEYIAQSKIKDKYFYSFLPESMKSGLNHFVSYLTHGYKGLSFAMKKDFTSSYGLGFSDFFRHNFLKLIGKSSEEEKIYKRTYMHKILADGWETGAVWSTFFIFPASDIGFPLTVLLIFFIGMLFSVLWRDSIESKNVLAAILFVNLCMIICFFCANNGYLQNGSSFVTIVLIGILWIISRIFCRGE